MVCLADAQRFLTIDEPYRLLVGRYRQAGGRKEFTEVREYLVTPEDHARLCAGVDAQDVAQLSQDIKNYGAGQHGAARLHAKESTQKWKDTLLTINPKIDSKSQRRVQCSIPLHRLDELVEHKTVHTENYGCLALPLAIQSTPRQYRDKPSDLP